MSHSHHHNHGHSGQPVPRLVVFDLDMCCYSPEMFQLSSTPKEPIMGDLGGNGEGVAAVRAGRDTVSLFPGALKALQDIQTNPEFKNTKVGAASTTNRPDYAEAVLRTLEILPGVKMGSLFTYKQIGCTPPLSHSKISHFKNIHKDSGIPYSEMLFFDDCNWGDNCAEVSNKLGVVAQKTPNGMTVGEWKEGLAKFAKSKHGSKH